MGDMGCEGLMPRLVFLMLLATAFSLPFERTTKIGGAFSDKGEASMTVKMPLSNVPYENQYRCSGHKLTEDAGILSFTPLPSDKQRVHHMTIYFCPTEVVDPALGVVGCPKDLRARCKMFGGYEHMGATAEVGTVRFGPDTGVNVGPSAHLKYAVLEVHNNLPLELDESGFRLQYTHGHLAKQVVQGLVDCGSSPIPGSMQEYNVSCTLPWHAKTASIVMLHFHFHSLGSQISWSIEHANGSVVEPSMQYKLGDAKTQLVGTPIQIHSGDKIHLTCTYNTSAKASATAIGPSSTDEMCNLFFAYY